MKVVLLAHVKKLGQKGDIVDVSEGMFRNMLAPRKLARVATDSAVKHVQVQKAKAVEKLENMKESAQSVYEKINGKTLTITEKSSGEGKLYAAVSTKEVAEHLKTELKVVLNPKAVEMTEAIKHTGEYQVKVKLFKDITANITINVVAA